MGMALTGAQVQREAREAHGRFVRHVRTCDVCTRRAGQGLGWCRVADRLEREADVTGNRAEAWERGY